jgi:hypothetical protein
VLGSNFSKLGPGSCADREKLSGQSITAVGRRAGSITVGIATLCLSALAYVWSAPKVEYYRSVAGRVTSFLGGASAAQEVHWAQLLYNASIAGFVIGAVVTLAGAILLANKPNVGRQP